MEEEAWRAYTKRRGGDSLILDWIHVDVLKRVGNCVLSIYVESKKLS